MFDTRSRAPYVHLLSKPKTVAFSIRFALEAGITSIRDRAAQVCECDWDAVSASLPRPQVGMLIQGSKIDAPEFTKRKRA